jgi:hypothetical protein
LKTTPEGLRPAERGQDEGRGWRELAPYRTGCRRFCGLEKAVFAPPLATLECGRPARAEDFSLDQRSRFGNDQRGALRRAARDCERRWPISESRLIGRMMFHWIAIERFLSGANRPALQLPRAGTPPTTSASPRPIQSHSPGSRRSKENLSRPSTLSGPSQ